MVPGTFSLNNSYLSSLFRELGQNTPVEYDYRGLQNRTPLERCSA